jgi:hypothetical protein
VDDLVQWLWAALDEDERIARRAGDSFRQIGETGVIVATEGDRAEECASANWTGVAEHIVRHDPARVLRELEAKRRVLARHRAAPVPPGNEWIGEYPYCAAHAYRVADGTVVYPVELKDCPELRDLAAPYSDRPGYREEWRP